MNGLCLACKKPVAEHNEDGKIACAREILHTMMAKIKISAIAIIPIFFLLGFVNQVDALIYDNGVEAKSHNCMSAEPIFRNGVFTGKYGINPCTSEPSSAQNFNKQKSQTTSNPSLQNSQSGFIGENPNAIQEQTPESPPIVTHTEVQHVVMHEITNQQGAEPQKAVTDNNEIWWAVLISSIIVTSVIVLGLALRVRRSSLVYSSPHSSNVSNTRIERTTDFQSRQRIETEIREEQSFQNWNEELWADVKKRFPRDWTKILEWIAKNPEDVKVIIEKERSNKAVAEAIMMRMLASSREKQGIKCEVCKKNFYHEDDLHRHLKIEHLNYQGEQEK